MAASYTKPFGMAHSPAKGNATAGKRRKNSEGERQNMWTQLLDNVASGKKLPEKTMLVLGGTTESQREFLESVSQDPMNKRRPQDRKQNRKPPIANQYALGYTYQDVLDADQEDLLARLSIYLLANPSPAFAPLLKPLMTTDTLSDMLIVILLDWAQPWLWVRQLRQWIRNLRSVFISLDDDCKDVMEENIVSWRERRRGAAEDGTITSTVDLPITLGPGEWDEPLGVPLCVVCQNAERTETLEKEQSWKEEQFDFIMQYMRTILLKHGASLIYTTPSAPGLLRPLVHTSLSITSLLQRTVIKHNVIDRDKVLVPPNWDSWGKIRVLREGFDVEGVSKAWSVEIQLPQEAIKDDKESDKDTNGRDGTEPSAMQEGGPAVSVYESTVEDPERYNPRIASSKSKSIPDIEVEVMDNQKFLAGQLEILERLRKEDEQEKKTSDAKKSSSVTYASQNSVEGGQEGDLRNRVSDKIGPIQFNMGGIQVDADDMLRRLKDREADRTQAEEATSPFPTDKMKNEELADFFAGLMKRGGRSNPGTPR